MGSPRALGALMKVVQIAVAIVLLMCALLSFWLGKGFVRHWASILLLSGTLMLVDPFVERRLWPVAGLALTVWAIGLGIGTRGRQQQPEATSKGG